MKQSIRMIGGILFFFHTALFAQIDNEGIATHNKDNFLIGTNTLMSQKGKIFTKYEGMYFYNPVQNSIEFTTINQNEIHTGTCRVKGDTLFHAAQIAGNGKTKSYSSAPCQKRPSNIAVFCQLQQSKNSSAIKVHSTFNI